MNHKKIRVLSLFDGISCARVALDRAGIEVGCYMASEIDEHAIAVSKANYPDIIHVGSVKDVTSERLSPGGVDLLIGGSPCQDLSIAKKGRQGLKGSRSGLFWEYVRILNDTKPRYFVLENVASMPKEDRQTITETLGVEPIMIDASMVSGQIRKRLFWTNIPHVGQPVERNISLYDISHEFNREPVDLEKYSVTASHLEWICTEDPLYTLQVREATKAGFKIATPGCSVDLAFPNSKTRRGRVGTKAKNLMTSPTIGIVGKGYVRMITPVECERLQSLPDGYTSAVSERQRYKALGNAFNVEVVAHILRHINRKNPF